MTETDSAGTDIDVPRNMPGDPEMPTERKRREYDDRCARIMRIVTGLRSLGLTPRVIEVDGTRVEIDTASPVAATPALPTTSETPSGYVGVGPGPKAPSLPSEDDDVMPISSPIRSYRSKAQATLQRRLKAVSE